MSAWKDLADPDNPENRNAGNGGDLVKHTVTTTFLRTLREVEPWRSTLEVHEVHAGRGMYVVAASDPRRVAIDRLLASDHPLATTLREALRLAGADPSATYPGSTALHATLDPTRHLAYEWSPATRRILRAVVEAAGFRTEVIDPGPDVRFDGETHLAERLPALADHAAIMLDPFGIWRHPRHASRRGRYRRLLQARREQPLSCFFTWGQNARGEAADMRFDEMVEVFGARAFRAPEPDDEIASRQIADGYVDLARLAGDIRIRVRWHWDLRCAMWILVPPRLGIPMGGALARALRDLEEVMPPEASYEVARVEARPATCFDDELADST